MALSEEDRKDVQTIIDDALAGAGEQFATQARTAAEEVLAKIGAQVETLAGRVEEAAKAGADPEAVRKVVADALAAEMAGRDEAAKKAADDEAAGRKVADAREAFLREKAPKVPEAYRAHIPQTDDPAALEAGLAKAVAALQADAKAFGWALPNIGAPAGGPAAGTAPDPANLSPTQKIAQGLSTKQ